MVKLTWSCGHSGYIPEDWLKNYKHSKPDELKGDLSRPSLAVSSMKSSIWHDVIIIFLSCVYPPVQMQIPRLSAMELCKEEGVWT